MSENNKIRVAINGYGVIGKRVADNQAIVVPETIDAIRALTGLVRDASESIARTNTAMGLGPTLM